MFLKQIKYKNIKSNYLISNTGLILNSKTNKYIKPWEDKQNGYLYVSLMSNDNKVVKESLHVLVFIHFGKKDDVKKYIDSIGKYKYTINHKDGIKHNCNIKNLEIATYKENYVHARKHNLISLGENLNYAKTTNDLVNKICKLIEDGKRNKEIVSILNLNEKYYKTLITNIRTGKKWKHISDNYKFDKISSLRHNSNEYVKSICELIELGCKLKEMRYLLHVNNVDKDRFKKLVYGIRKRQIYKEISENYNWWKNGSTTIENDCRDIIIFNSKSIISRVDTKS